MILERMDSGKSVDEAFRTSTDGPGHPISRAYRPAGFIDLCRNAGFDASFSGGYFNRHEVDWLQKHRDRALASVELAEEHKAFLRDITDGEDGKPQYHGVHCGIGGVYHLRQK